ESRDVRHAVMRNLDFWFGLGVDGLRLDAIPYLFERDGTNCENLPETHAFLKELRRHVDQRWKDRMLLAEANQWPEDAAQYFGSGDECHMAFHFPVMPRLFMAVHMEDRFPIIDIRRRLGPLLGNDRRRMELMNALLLSLPGTPVLYYGDEIGMGDNIYLGDRNGVRTPMQWSGDRNAGFSRCNPQKLYLPVNIDPEYHYEAINVETQENNPHSLLWWTMRLLAQRKQLRAMGRGSLEFLY